MTILGQLLEVYDVQGSAGKARLTVDGKVLFATDFNKDCIYPNGSAIFIHVKGSKPYTGGCISFDEDRMVEILKNCDMSLVIKISE